MPNIRSATVHDAIAICDIYNPYVLNTNANFEIEAVTPESMAQRITKIFNQGLPWIVLEDDNYTVIAYAYADRYRERAAYEKTVLTSIYFKDDAPKGQGLGTLLYQRLLNEIKMIHKHVVLSLITLPNPASSRLHEKLGFKKVGVFNEVGLKHGEWLSSECWEYLIPCDI
jgi:L-amino acid N-acyltransferase YncA